jgi:hypothetical protein
MEEKVRVKREYRLIKLRAATVQDLKQLQVHMGKGSLDSVVRSLIRLMDKNRQGLKETGWHVHGGGDSSEDCFGTLSG